MDIIDGIYSIKIGSSIQEVKDALSNLYVGYEYYDENLETDRLDHKFNTSCKRMSFEFDDNGSLTDIEEIF